MVKAQCVSMWAVVGRAATGARHQILADPARPSRRPPPAVQRHCGAPAGTLGVPCTTRPSVQQKVGFRLLRRRSRDRISAISGTLDTFLGKFNVFFNRGVHPEPHMRLWGSLESAERSVLPRSTVYLNLVRGPESVGPGTIFKIGISQSLVVRTYAV